jgi:hypothetical protein
MLIMQGVGNKKEERMNDNRKNIPKRGSFDVGNMVKSEIAMMTVFNQ